jgi:hypothetical protein
MYWLVSKEQEEGQTWLTYNYFDFITVNPSKTPYYNGVLKKTVYPENCHLIIRSCNAESEEQFMTWWYKNKANI